MEDIKNIFKLINNFSKFINQNKTLIVHKENKFNKQFNILLTELNYIEIIVKRIEKADQKNEILQLNLDLKTLYVFGRVFSESLIYLVSLFIKSSSNINWSKIGPFIASLKKNMENEPQLLKDFWINCEKYINNLNESFKYRNDVLHEKESNTEWTFSDPLKSNLDSIYIYNVPWPEEKNNKKEKHTLNTRTIIKNLYDGTSGIINYLNLIINT